jgi:hypothetical protein
MQIFMICLSQDIQAGSQELTLLEFRVQELNTSSVLGMYSHRSCIKLCPFEKYILLFSASL